MLQEVTGTRLFDEKLDKMNNALDEAQAKKEALRSVLREIELKLEGLSVDKDTYAKIEAIELRKKAYQKLQLLDKIDEHNNEASQLRQQRANLLQ